jgi:hypothetical protein
VAAQLFSGEVEHVTQYVVALLAATTKHIEHPSSVKPDAALSASTALSSKPKPAVEAIDPSNSFVDPMNPFETADATNPFAEQSLGTNPFEDPMPSTYDSTNPFAPPPPQSATSASTSRAAAAGGGGSAYPRLTSVPGAALRALALLNPAAGAR